MDFLDFNRRWYTFVSCVTRHQLAYHGAVQTDTALPAVRKQSCEADLYLSMMRADHQQGSLSPQVFRQVCPDCTQSPGNTISTFITNHNPGSTVRFTPTLNAKRPKLQFQPKSGPQAMNVRVYLGSQAASTAPAACL